jgi:hypothetical protein
MSAEVASQPLDLHASAFQMLLADSQSHFANADARRVLLCMTTLNARRLLVLCIIIVVSMK